MKNNVIITISREYGSGGRKVGEAVAKKLGIPFYDKEIIDKAATDSGLSPDFIEKEEQTFSNSVLFNLATANGQYSSGMSLVDQIYITESNAIKDFASQGSCVIVGRCADYILKDDYDCFNVFVYAKHEFRLNRIMSEYDVNKKQAERTIKSRDKTRSRHYNYYCDHLWGNRNNYHIMLDSSEFGIEKTADLIIQAVKTDKE